VKKNYKISIVIPNFNGERFIWGCIESILSQSYQDYEIIIVDGKSTDGSHTIIEKFVWISKKIKWLKVNDTGISNGFNLGIEQADWDFVILLWSDDYLYDDILHKLNCYIVALSDFWYIDVTKCNIFCDSINYWSEHHQLIKRTPQSSIFTSANLIKYGNMVGFQNIFINRGWFNRYRINEKNKYSMDYESYFEMLKSGQIFVHLPEINSINCLWDNTTCKYWYQSQKEANGISLRYAKHWLDYLYVFKRFFLRESLRFAKYISLVK
jgi:glycosyltransferase involved in cell wall biosynthesis